MGSEFGRHPPPPKKLWVSIRPPYQTRTPLVGSLELIVILQRLQPRNIRLVLWNAELASWNHVNRNIADEYSLRLPIV